jgi:hypothetical protein
VFHLISFEDDAYVMRRVIILKSCVWWQILSADQSCDDSDDLMHGLGVLNRIKVPVWN